MTCAPWSRLVPDDVGVRACVAGGVLHHVDVLRAGPLLALLDGQRAWVDVTKLGPGWVCQPISSAVSPLSDGGHGVLSPGP